MATSPASAAATAGRVTTVVTETMAGWCVLMTVDGYSKLMEADECIESDWFCAGCRRWYMYIIGGAKEAAAADLATFVIGLESPDDEVKVRYKLTLLNRAGEIISATQSFATLSSSVNSTEMGAMDTQYLLEDSFQIRCEVAVVTEITAARPPDLPRHLGGLLASQVGADATFQVGGEVFAAHRCVLAARSGVFMAELFGPGKGTSAAAAAPVRIDGVEPRVFRALLHFIYTDSLPEVEVGEGGGDDDEVAMARGLLAAADRFGVESLKLICGDVLCNSIDARTAVDLLELADNHGCPSLKAACVKVIKDLLAKVSPSSSPIRKRQKKLN
ncbi:BTB/POZ and MATH domain-containing protein 1-like [Panicum virgatum]|uniref:BTB/POZ and MATH domain-containing protein 1-like n=1 Tax=Panicum virgatum TaxID=38727 RepID=UPI0019D5293D|nr:BTB/POZ and MATH domain-containing protein 1-like [Panicum virgatum]